MIANPEGTPREVFDGIREGVAANRSQFFQDLAVPFYGHNREGAQVSKGLEDAFWRQGMQGGLKALAKLKSVRGTPLDPPRNPPPPPPPINESRSDRSIRGSRWKAARCSLACATGS